MGKARTSIEKVNQFFSFVHQVTRRKEEKEKEEATEYKKNKEKQGMGAKRIQGRKKEEFQNPRKW